MKKKIPKKKLSKKKTIFERKNITEDQFLAALDIVTKKLVHKFKFGYHNPEDMKQQAAIFALQGLEKYDSSRPLENFLWTHIRNRLFNYKRDNYHRPDNVCLTCPFYDPTNSSSINQCKKFINKNECEIYSCAQIRNELKKNIMSPSDIDISHTINNKKDFLEEISNKEILSIIENNISTKYREYYLKLKSGVKISSKEKEKLKLHIQYIIKSYYGN